MLLCDVLNHPSHVPLGQLSRATWFETLIPGLCLFSPVFLFPITGLTSFCKAIHAFLNPTVYLFLIDNLILQKLSGCVLRAGEDGTHLLFRIDDLDDTNLTGRVLRAGERSGWHSYRF